MVNIVNSTLCIQIWPLEKLMLPSIEASTNGLLAIMGLFRIKCGI